MSKLVLLGGALLLAAMLTACGDDSNDDAAQTALAELPVTSVGNTPVAIPTDGPEVAFAKSMVLTAADFPGFIETPDTRPLTDHPVSAACSQEAEKGNTGRAISSGFAAGSSAPSISEVVVVFRTEEDASAGLAESPSFVDCAVNVVNAGKLDKTAFVLSGATSHPIVVAAPGDGSFAFQIDAKGRTTSVPASEFDLAIQMVFVRVGRVVFQLTVSGSGEPTSQAELAGYLAKAAARIKQQP